MYTTARAGFTPTAALVVDVLASIPGLATEQLVGALNDLRVRSAAIAQHGHFARTKAVQDLCRGMLSFAPAPVSVSISRMAHVVQA